MFDERSRLVFETLPQLVGYADSKLRCRYFNHASENFLGAVSSEIVGKKLSEVFGERLFSELEPYATQALEGSRVSLIRELETKTGKINEAKFDLIPDFADEGIAGFMIVIEDVSQKHLVERLDTIIKERNDLILELDHRVNNILQVMQSILALEERAILDSETREDKGPRGLIQAIDARFGAMALIYGLLRRKGAAAGAAADEIIDRVCEFSDILLSADIEDGLMIPPRQLDAFIFIAEELMRNAVPKGSLVNVTVRRSADGGITFTVKDRGPGLVNPEIVNGRHSVGFALVNSYLQGSAASMRYEYDGGARFTVKFPALPPDPSPTISPSGLGIEYKSLEN